MDPGKLCEGQTQQYYPHAHFTPNPSLITPADASAPASTPAPAPAPATSHVYEAHGAGTAVAPPGVEHAHNPYATHGGYEGQAPAYVYPAAGAAPYYHGYGGGDAQGFVATDGIPQYGVLHPVTNADVLGRLPSVSIYQNNKATHPPQNGLIWKKKKKILKAVQPAYCEVCKIACNSQEVLNSHRQGRKHKKNLEKLKESIAPKPAKAPMKVVERKEPPESDNGKTGGEKTNKKSAPANEVDLETKRRKVLEGGAAAEAVKVCTICNVVCNSAVVFNYHVAGQKHAAMVKKQQAAPVS